MTDAASTNDAGRVVWAEVGIANPIIIKAADAAQASGRRLFLIFGLYPRHPVFLGRGLRRASGSGHDNPKYLR
jgi:hypothetical protein